jgi:ketosteroid isomerase-like protein
MDKQAFLKSVMGSVDAKDAERFISHLTDDATFKFANMDPVTGKENIEQAVAGFFDSIKGLSHKLLDTVEQDGTIAMRGEVTYTRHDDSQLTIPFVNFFKINGYKIKEYLIYVDASQLYA